MPLSINYLKTIYYSSLLDKLGAKVEGWKTSSSSFAGRLELIKSILTNIISYWYQFYNFPKNIPEVDRVCANFLGKDKMPSWSWKDTCCLKQKVDWASEEQMNYLRSSAGLKLVLRQITSDSLCAN